MIRKTFWLAGALSLVLAACDDDDDDDLVNPPGNTSVSVALTSTSGDVVSSVITIDQIMLQGSGVTRVDLLDAPVTVNLTDLANATQEIVTGAEAANGTYSDIRMVISGAFVELANDDGTTTIYASAQDYAGLPEGAVVGGTLTLPANPQDGAVITFDENVTLNGGSVTLLIDFDLDQSVIDDGAGGFNLTPFIRGGSGADAGTVAVTLGLGEGVTLPEGTTLANFTATLGGKRLVFTDNAGTFTSNFAHVLPGTYSLNLVGPGGLTFVTDPVVPLDVTVDAAGQVTQTVTITEATAAAVRR
jgi:hypothetical protein